MGVSLIILDDFYNDPDSVRNFALQQNFNSVGNFPGRRTQSFLTDQIKEIIERTVCPYAGNIVWWGDSSTGAFQYTTQSDRSWIHADQTTTWAGVCYLTPNAPYSSGTGLMRHKQTGLRSIPHDEDGNIDNNLLNEIYKDSQDITKWELLDSVGNVYNRLVLYRGDFFHTSLDYFGRDISDGRLFQIFFFTTEF